MGLNPRNGYSLVEVMMGLAILAAIILAANGHMVKIMQQASKVSALGRVDTSFRGFGQRLMFDLQLADVALSFQRLPIPLSGCANTTGKLKPGPCVYQLKDKLLIPPNSSWTSAKAVEFFRDYDSNLNAHGINGLTTDDMKNFQMKRLTRLPIDEQMYAAWVIKDEKSMPFTMMSRTSAVAYFIVADEFASSSPSSTAGRFVMMRGSDSNIALDTMARKLMVVFNGYAPTQYFVQKIGNIINCRLQSCLSIAKALNPAFDMTKLTEFYAIELLPIKATPFNVPLPVADLGAWGAQPASEFMFPTQYPSISLPGSPNLTAPADARKLMHFYHVHQLKAQLLAIPVEFKGYYFEKAKGDKKRMLCKKISGDLAPQIDTVLNDVPQDAFGVFGRKLGTQDVSFFIYK